MWLEETWSLTLLLEVPFINFKLDLRLLSSLNVVDLFGLYTVDKVIYCMYNTYNIH